jgi:hypothetical protein
MIHILRVYWRYYWGRLLGRRVKLFGKPGTARFKCVRFADFNPGLYKQVPIITVPKLPADDSEPTYSDPYKQKPGDQK